MIIKTSFDIKGQIDVANDGEKGFHAFKKRTEQQLKQERCDCGIEDCPNRFYSLVFMDINMPVMDGFESTTNIMKFQEQLRQKAAVVALTAYSNPAYLSKCEQVGMAKVLQKPAKATEIQEVTSKYCPKLCLKRLSNKSLTYTKQ